MKLSKRCSVGDISSSHRIASYVGVPQVILWLKGSTILTTNVWNISFQRGHAKHKWIRRVLKPSKTFGKLEHVTSTQAPAYINVTTTRGVTNGPKEAQFPGRRITEGAPNHRGGAEWLRRAPKSPNNVPSTFFSIVHLLPKGLCFEHAGSKFASYPGRHLISPLPLHRTNLSSKVGLQFLR